MAGWNLKETASISDLCSVFWKAASRHRPSAPRMTVLVWSFFSLPAADDLR
ncbi:hypothetical protein [Actinomadura violacea]|uniref:Uncharacterized protein n=1 Tax=Actinomadura violacea TaxID=2819934 RepID=A0ABS3RQC0_9ACTN|nr:hypothetical protein [Actinomadura violacea]MBO2458841.1 hypothetical protein [Actinomadura violacea]